VKRLAILLALATPAIVRADSLLPDAHFANAQLSDPAREKVARDLMETIRCLVCQGQSIADSNADLAGDMRALIRQRVDQGEDPEAIRKWMVERYGNWVTYKPPLLGIATPIWILPFLFLIAGALLARGRFRRRSR
jgi:cytochrome c-type biogenesis protein CcmH